MGPVNISYNENEVKMILVEKILKDLGLGDSDVMIEFFVSKKGIRIDARIEPSGTFKNIEN